MIRTVAFGGLCWVPLLVETTILEVGLQHAHRTAGTVEGSDFRVEIRKGTCA